MKNSDPIVKEAVALAEAWQNRADELLSRREKNRYKKLARLLSNPADKILMTKLIDQSFRSRNPARVADQICYLLSEFGIPEFFSRPEKLLLLLFLTLGKYFPDFTVPRIIDKIRKDSGYAVISADGKSFDRYLDQRKNEAVRININHLGEAVLGEEEARAQLRRYIRDLKNPAIEHISVKISTLFSQIQPLAFDHSVNMISARLCELYRTAAAQHFTGADGRQSPKFINLDMESYRDLAITAAAFMRTLDQPEFKHYSAGMALQAYLPDSFGMLRDITAWARRRVAVGGSPIKIRIVKGANMEMEKVEAAIFDWPQAPYDNKLDTDANYKRMVDFGMAPENIQAVRLGVASHNPFELAYAYLRAEQNKVLRYFSFEMLEGMADHLRRAVQETGREVVLYAPLAARKQFIHAIAYLIRRLDENSGPQNFLRHLSSLHTKSHAWQSLVDGFAASVSHMPHAGLTPHRRQNRLGEKFSPQMGTFFESEFKNEPNTDWSLAANRQWAETIRQKWKKGPEDRPVDIPVVVGGEEIFSERTIRNCHDPSEIGTGVIVARFALANAGDVERAVAAAKADMERWRDTRLKQRHLLLSRVATEIRRSRGDLIGAAAADTGKVFSEADIEVPEAVDFTEYYPHSAGAFEDIDNVRCRGKPAACRGNGQSNRLRPHLRFGKPGSPRATPMERPHSGGQPVPQPGDHRCGYPAPALRRNGKIRAGRGNQGRRAEICGAIYGF